MEGLTHFFPTTRPSHAAECEGSCVPTPEWFPTQQVRPLSNAGTFFPPRGGTCLPGPQPGLTHPQRLTSRRPSAWPGELALGAPLPLRRGTLQLTKTPKAALSNFLKTKPQNAMASAWTKVSL